MRRTALVFVCAAVAAAIACGSSDDVTHDPSEAGAPDVGTDAVPDAATVDASSTTPFTVAAMRAAADAFNAKFCPRYQACQPTLFEFYYGSIAECMAAGGLIANAVTNQGIAVRYFDELTAPYGYGSLLTPDSLAKCAAALDFSTCGKVFDFTDELVTPPECHDAFFGSLENGSDCRTWNQCKGGRCLGSSGRAPGACGQCFSTNAEGDPCFNPFTCPPGTLCSGVKGAFTCQRPRQLGESCTPERPCHAELVCSSGTCIAPPAQCDPAIGCSGVPYLRTCNETTHLCEATPLAQIGEACGSLPVQPGQSNAEVRCARGGYCAVVSIGSADGGVDDAGDPIVSLVCQPLIADGLPCNASYEADFACKTPDSLCYENICQQHGPADCPKPSVPP